MDLLLMNIQHEHGEAVTVGFRDRTLFRYVYSPDTPADQAPKPFFLSTPSLHQPFSDVIKPVSSQHAESPPTVL